MGSAFLDYMIPADSEIYRKESKGSRSLTKAEFLEFKEGLKDPPIPGGSAANAMAIFAQLGGKASFYSTIGRDKEGEIWARSLNNLGVNMQLHTCDREPTGGCLSFVNSDGQRSMRTYGGTENIADNNLDSMNFDEKPTVFVEGYGLNSEAKRPVYLKALERAKQAGAYIVLSASDPFCIINQRDLFISLIQTTADLIIMNEEEACALVSGDLKTCIKFIQTTGKRAVITLGAAGAIAVDGENIWECPARKVEVVDTTGAGDGFAGGFLYGLSAGWEIPECLQLGSYMAGKVVAVPGGRLEGKQEVEAKEYKELFVQRLKIAGG